MDTKTLRQKILDIAIRGKLVPQDPNDEPASVLLDRISAEKERLIKEGKIKRSKKNASADKPHYENMPFDIPDSWAWIRLKDVSEIARGGSPRPIKEYLTNDDNGINWIKIGDAEKDGKYINSTKEKIKLEGVRRSRFVHKGDFLLTNSMSFGHPYILNVDGCIHDGWLVISPFASSYDSNFLYYLLSSGFAYEQFSTIASGGVVSNLNSDKVADSYFPLPPISEQCRIVKSIEKFTSVIDIINNEQSDIANLVTAAKAKVLDLAIHGELVPQDNEEESAIDLLHRINPDFKTSDASHYENLPFIIPDNWVWERFGEISKWQSGATPSRNNKLYYGGDIPWLKTGDLNDGYVEYIPETITAKALQETSVKLTPADSVLLAMYGATIGKVGILKFPATTNQACCACIKHEGITTKYLFYFLLSHKEQFIEQGMGGAQPNISKEKIIETYIPIPPLKEQDRIVLKIETIFKALDFINNTIADEV